LKQIDKQNLSKKINVSINLYIGLGSIGMERGEIKWRSAPKDMLVLAFAGGLFVGLGAIIVQGCFVGQVLSGWALLASQALIFGIIMILTNWITTLFYLRGWR